MKAEYSTPLDPAQLIRIESVHRGFYYQDLYAAGCLLQASSVGVQTLLVEHDEDAELLTTGEHLYLQVKTRQRPLASGDISDALERFKLLRQAHSSGNRQRISRFFIISNSSPTSALREQLRSDDWPSDVSIYWPDHPGPHDARLPPVLPDLQQMLTWCTSQATSIPFRGIAADSLVLKLASIIHYASTGASADNSHCFSAAELPDLFEQIVVQLQDFPVIPNPYRATDQEPIVASSNATRLIVALPGGGKTAWAAKYVLVNGETTSYFDVSDTPGSALASSLSRELAARFLDGAREGLSRILLTGATGLDTLRLVSSTLHQRGRSINVVVDNAQRVTADELDAIVLAAPSIRFILLARPDPVLAEVEARLAIRAEYLAGWSLDDIAAEFAELGNRIDPATADGVRQLTGGLPLYVRSASRLAQAEHGGDAADFVQTVKARMNDTAIAQDIILTRTFNVLPSLAQQIAALLGLADVALARDEIRALLAKPLGVTDAQLFLHIRELTQQGLVQKLQDGRLLLHDAFRPIATDKRNTLTDALVLAAQTGLKSLILASLPTSDVQRLRLLLHLLADTRDVEPLVDLAGSEQIYELGITSEILNKLETLGNNADLNAKHHYLAFDALAFHALQSRHLGDASRWLERMEPLLPRFDASPRMQTTLLMKQMQLELQSGSAVTARRHFDRICVLLEDDHEMLRIVRHNFAVALFHAGDRHESMQRANELIKEYFQLLGLTPEEVYAKNPEEIWPNLPETESLRDDLKHLADALDLAAMSSPRRDAVTALKRLWAMKFYEMAYAVSSIIRVGQDIVDDLLIDPPNALQFIETSLLPTLKKFNLLQYLIPLRAQYAVVLAHCGEITAARSEMEQLAPYATAMTNEQRRKYENQRQLIKRLTERPQLHLSAEISRNRQQSGNRRKSKIGRNDACPCGSGKKYKHCHGANRA